jgi:hypothetical protein
MTRFAHGPLYCRPRFPFAVIANAVWLYVRFPLSVRRVEDKLAARGHRSVAKFRPTKAIHVLVDSTGLEVYGAGQWLEEKHGAKSRRGWRKLHLGLDADSGDIIAHIMTGQHMGDSSQVGALLDQIDGRLASLQPTAPMTATRLMTRSAGTAPMLPSSFHLGPTGSTARAQGSTVSVTGI